MNITCGETMVSSKNSVRYLGVDLDQSLDGNTPFSITTRTPHGEQRWTVLIRQLLHFNNNTPHSEQLRTILFRQLFTRKLVQAVYYIVEYIPKKGNSRLKFLWRHAVF